MGKLVIVAALIMSSVIRFQTANCSRETVRLKHFLPQEALDYVDERFEQLRKFESSLISNTLFLKQFRPEAKLYFASRASLELLDTGFDALKEVEASVYLSGRSEVGCINAKDERCAALVSRYSLNFTNLASHCQAQTTTVCNLSAGHRSYDGSCNNKANVNLGKAGTVYRRYLPPNYFKGIYGMASLDDTKFGGKVSNPRIISSNISVSTFPEENDITLAFAVFAQFIANDLALTPIIEYITQNAQITCCTDDGHQLGPRFIHPYCAEIEVPKNDSVYHRHDIRCLSYVRSLPAFKPNCSFGPLEQMNHATHLLDGSMIYGTSYAQAGVLRQHMSGMLRTRKIDLFHYLPVLVGNYSNECPGQCVEAGDNRANEHPQLTALHTIFVREHNRIASCLARAHPRYTDDLLYQEARRLVIAEIQHITYNEFLRLLVGDEIWAVVNAEPYNPNVSPAVNNEVGNAVLKFPLSMLQQNISLMDENRDPTPTEKISNLFFRPHMVEKLLNELVRGMTTQASQKLDVSIVPDLINKYYSGDGELGLDALSFAIQQGRDHGFPPYIRYREACGLPPATEIDDLTNIPSDVRQKLKALNPNLDSIDLIIGGLAENRDHGILGQTFACLILDQFRRTRAGDRFFYLHDDQPRPFKGEELERIKKVTLAAVICRNSDGIQSLQRNVFQKIGPNNYLVNCMEQGEWKEGICI